MQIQIPSKLFLAKENTKESVEAVNIAGWPEISLPNFGDKISASQTKRVLNDLQLSCHKLNSTHLKGWTSSSKALSLSPKLCRTFASLLVSQQRSAGKRARAPKRKMEENKFKSYWKWLRITTTMATDKRYRCEMSKIVLLLRFHPLCFPFSSIRLSYLIAVCLSSFCCLLCTLALIGAAWRLARRMSRKRRKEFKAWKVADLHKLTSRDNLFTLQLTWRPRAELEAHSKLCLVTIGMAAGCVKFTWIPHIKSNRTGLLKRKRDEESFSMIEGVGWCDVIWYCSKYYKIQYARPLQISPLSGRTSLPSKKNSIEYESQMSPRNTSSSSRKVHKRIYIFRNDVVWTIFVCLCNVFCCVSFRLVWSWTRLN